MSLDTSLRARGDKGQFVFVANDAPKLDMKNDLELAVADDAANQLLTSMWSARAFDTEIELATGAYGKVGDYYDSVQLQLVVPPHVEATGSPLELRLIETPDVVAQLGAIKQSQWMVAFALETEDPRMQALQKLERKSCDLIVVNGPAAIHATDTDVEILDVRGEPIAALSGTKQDVSGEILRVIQERLIDRN